MVELDDGTQILTESRNSEKAVGTTAGRVQIRGLYNFFEIRSPEGCRVEVAYIIWDNDERDVRALAVGGKCTPGLLALGRGNKRLTVEPPRTGNFLPSFYHVCTLRMVVQDRNDPNPVSIKWLSPQVEAELDAGAGLPVFTVLRKYGAVDVGQKSVVIQDLGRSRGQFCTVFPKDNLLVPVIAFALTRVLPLARGYQP